MRKKERTSTKTTYLHVAFGCLVILAVVTMFWPGLTPFRFFEFWTIQGSLWEAVFNAWPIYLFGIGLNSLILFTKWQGYTVRPRTLLFAGFGISLWAGVMEEICFRWLIFFSAIVTIQFGDWLLLGFMGLHLVRWMYVYGLIPLANFLTLGFLEPLLLNGFGWAVGAAVISANGQFHKGHLYQGWFGASVSWFLGMYFFWVMFNYGLIAAIIVHFLYDLFIFSLVALDALWEKSARHVLPSR